ncbi:hypothetical protein Esti_006500 [Eimeria stiedai]
MGSASSILDWLVLWTPTLIAGVAVATGGSYLLSRKGGCSMMNRACCSAQSRGKEGIAEGREKDIVEDINPPCEGLPRFTLEQLKECDGKEGRRLFVAIQGLVYDVGAHEAGRHFYGPQGAYALFAGKEVTTALAKMALEEHFLNQPPSSWSSFSEEEKKCICSWAKKLSAKYPLAGVVDFGPEGIEAAAGWRGEIARLQC